MALPAYTFADVKKQINRYLPDADFVKLDRAYQLAESAHSGQVRESGLEYISHPINVAKILADLQMDLDSIIAGILHDVVEDTKYSTADLKEMFGDDVSMLVDGVTKLEKISYKSKEEQKLENYIKMFLAMAKDIRVVIIKLADRLHNMRTLKFTPEDKQKRIAQETLDIFAPLAHRLGIFMLKWELEDLAFRYLEPEQFYELVELVKVKKEEREKTVREAAKLLEEKLQELDIKAEIQWRSKHLWSIFQKMRRDSKELSEIYDLAAIRLIVSNVKDCYGALGVVHTLWKPLPGRFKDYVAMPKSNGYQSLHTTVAGIGSSPLEIQIRTPEMHRQSEYGVAAHWRYKEGSKGPSVKRHDEKLAWLRQLLEWQDDGADASEVVESVKLDLFSDEIFVFTPRGDVISLPVGSIPIDFAYRVHTEVGHRCIGAKINGKIVSIDTKLTTGDIVEVITSKSSNGPSRDWVNIAGASDTKHKIKQWFKKERKEENIERGRELLEKELKRLNYELKEILKEQWLLEIGQRHNYNTEDDLYAAIGFGDISPQTVITKLVTFYNKEHNINKQEESLEKLLADLKPKTNTSKEGHGILVKGESGMMIIIARCCSPVPGDEIVGYITRGKGVSVHRADCPNITSRRDDYDRIIEVAWGSLSKNSYNVAIEISATDRSGLLTDIMVLAADSKLNISAVDAKALPDKTSRIIINLDIDTLVHLESIMNKFKRVRSVFKVRRAQSGGQ
ncbi:MAG: bifunctional (p)ppGpp synthetase/guanosine-3',5'-bis(diphosphate) 3'-pyrophosphohydrolase [Bacillota bacterium]